MINWIIKYDSGAHIYNTYFLLQWQTGRKGVAHLQHPVQTFIFTHQTTSHGERYKCFMQSSHCFMRRGVEKIMSLKDLPWVGLQCPLWSTFTTLLHVRKIHSGHELNTSHENLRGKCNAEFHYPCSTTCLIYSLYEQKLQTRPEMLEII